MNVPAADQPQSDSLSSADSWAVLHLFCRAPTKVAGAPLDAQGVVSAVKGAREGGLQVVTVALLGHKADLGVVAVGPDVAGLRGLQTRLRVAGLETAGSYVSLTEVSEYAAGVPDELKSARLHPVLPPAGMPAFCFYPMSKRRDQQENWYRLGFEERKHLMEGHGAVGRSFRGRVVQLVTGSTGLDDWEWGVTLFAVTLNDLKECVYRMRFDEASARYAEFGPFWTGMVADTETVLDRVLEG
jgi:chlorite dismutase